MTKKEQREIIFNKHGGKCAYCGDPLQKGWHVDELLPVRRYWKWKYDENGDAVFTKSRERAKTYHMDHPERLNVENQMPSCPSCNINKHSMSLEGFRNLISGFINSLNRDSTQYKVAKRYGLIQENTKPIVFYFEKDL